MSYVALCYMRIGSTFNILKLYINPILTYAGASYAPYFSNTQWRKLEAVQSIVTRTILSLQIHINNHVSFSTTSLSSIKSNIKKQSITLFNRNEKPRYSHIRKLGLTEHPFLSISNNPKPRPLAWALTPL